MTTQPKVSIIIPVHNTNLYLTKCLQSVLYQTEQAIEIICVNDGSTDDSLKTLTKFSKIHSNIKLINQENKGVSVARNIGLENATGEYVMFLDSDDWVKNTLIEETCKRLARDRADIVCFNVANYYSKTGMVQLDQFYPYDFWPNNPRTSVYTHRDYRNLFLGNFSCVNKLYKRTFLLENNIRFTENLAFEDHPFHLTTFVLAKQIVVVNKSLYFYRKNIKSFMTTIGQDDKILDMFIVLDELKKILCENDLFEEYKRNYYHYYLGILISMLFDTVALNKRSKFYKEIQKRLKGIFETNNVDEIYDKRDQNACNTFFENNWFTWFIKYNILGRKL